jgi:hypothetical protein
MGRRRGVGGGGTKTSLTGKGKTHTSEWASEWEPLWWGADALLSHILLSGSVLSGCPSSSLLRQPTRTHHFKITETLAFDCAQFDALLNHLSGFIAVRLQSKRKRKKRWPKVYCFAGEPLQW